MAKRCSPRTGCIKPRSRFWKKSLGVDWFDHNQSGYIQAFQEVLDYASDNAITAPTAAEKSAYNTFLLGLDNVGLLSRCKTANIYGFGSIEFGTINLANPNTYRHTAVGTTPTYTHKRGVKSAGAGSCFNTQYAVNEYAGIESDLTTIIDINDGGTTSSTDRVFGSNITSNTAQRLQLNTTARFTYGTTVSFTNQTDTRGLYIMTHDGTNSIVYKDGGKFSSANTPVTPTLSNKVLLLAYNTSTTSGVTVGTTPFQRNVMCLFRFDRFNDTDAENFRTLWRQFKNSVARFTNTYYVRPAGTTYGTGDGLSYANALAGFSAIPWTSLLPGDTIYIAGTHNELLTVAAQDITIRFDYSGDPGIIDGQNTRTRCIHHVSLSNIDYYGGTLQNPTTDGLGIYDNSRDVTVNSVTSIDSGNQAFQNEGSGTASPVVVYNDCTGTGCTDDGMSLHGTSNVTANRCTLSNNAQGVNAINSAVFVGNDCTIEDNATANAQPDTDADFTFNDTVFSNGLLNGNSTVALKMNDCTFNNCTFSGNYTITP